MLSSGVSRFHFDFFGLTVLKNFVRNPFKLPEIFGYRIFLCMRTEITFFIRNFLYHSTQKIPGNDFKDSKCLGSRKLFCISRFSFDFVLSHSSEKLREEPSNVSDTFKCQVSKKLMQKNGISRHSVENFLSQNAEKFRWGTLRYIRKVRLSKNFMPKRVISFSSVEFLSRLLPIILAGDPSVIQDLWDIEYFYAQYGGIAILR